MKLARQYTHFELQRSLVSKFLQKYVSVVTPKHHWKAFVDLWWMGKKTFLESYNTVTFFVTNSEATIKISGPQTAGSQILVSPNWMN